MFGKYSFHNLVKIYNDNKPLFDAYLDGHSVEGIDGDDSDTPKTLSGMSLFLIITLIIGHIVFWVFAIWFTRSNWDNIPDWVRIISVFCIIFNFPIISIILVYVGRTKKDQNFAELRSQCSGNYTNGW